MTQICRITAGTTIANLLGAGASRDYILGDGWAPAISQRRRATLGGYGPYQDVTERMMLTVCGTTAADCLANLALLTHLLDQAERWARGDPVTAVLFEWQPEGAAAALSAVILGYDGAQPGVGLPVSFDRELGAYVIRGVELRFRRRGLWIGASENATSAAVEIGKIATATLATAQTVPSPTDSEFYTSAASSSVSSNGMLVVVDDANALKVFEAHDLHAGAFTEVNDAALYPYGTSVLRYTPVTTVAATCAEATGLGLTAAIDQLAVIAVVRNNSATYSWNMRAVLDLVYGAVATPNVTIDASSASPRVVFLGVVAAPRVSASPFNGFYLEVTAQSTTGPPTLDIDTVYLVGLRPNAAHIIQLDWTLAAFTAPTPDEIKTYCRALTMPTPLITESAGGGTGVPMAYRGDPFIVTKSPSVVGAWIQPNGAYWRTVNFGGTDVNDYTLKAIRLAAAISPQ